MTRAPDDRLPPHQAGIPARLAAAGFSAEAASALLALDTEMFAWHRRALKGEIAGRLLAELGEPLELSQFHALTAIGRIEAGIGRAAPEPATVGLLAEEMALDPSRASRIAAGLIAAGWVKRRVAQDDGRKSVLVLTGRAREMIRRLRDLKWAKLMAVFAGWSGEEIVAFAGLFARYSEGIAAAYAEAGPPPARSP